MFRKMVVLCIICIIAALQGCNSIDTGFWGITEPGETSEDTSGQEKTEKGISYKDSEKREEPEKIRIANQDLFASLGFSLDTFSHKLIHVSVQDLFEITFKANPGADITVELYDLAMLGIHQFLERIILENNNGSYRMLVSFPRASTYRLEVSGRNKPGDEYMPLFYYEITAEKGMSLDDFYALYPGKSTEAVKKGASEWHIISRKVTMQSFDMAIHCYFEKKREEIALYYVNKSLVYLPALEKYMGETFPEKEIVIILDEFTDHAYMMFYGIHLAKHHMTKRFPSVLFHEFGHYYFGCTSYWFREGVNSFLPVAMIESGFMDKIEGAYDNILATWAFSSTNTENDAPVIDDSLMDRAYHFFYCKTFKIQYLLCRELGSENYREFIQDIYRYTWDDGDIEEFIVKTLQTYKERDWKRFLTGWVYEGDYTEYSFEDFKDKNKNAIPDIEDAYKQ